jgi:hypothetical protein
MKVQAKLLKLAGCPAPLNLDHRRRMGGSTQEDFETLLETFAMIRAYKIGEYGDSRIRFHKDEELETLWFAYGDIHRKYIRLRKQFREMKDPTTINSDQMLETLADLGNYVVQAIQIIMMVKGEFDADSTGDRS